MNRCWHLGLVLVVALANVSEAQTVIPTAGMRIALGGAGADSRMTYDWTDAQLNGCEAVLHWRVAISRPGDNLARPNTTPYSVRLRLGDLQEPVVSARGDEAVTIGLEVKPGRPPIQVEAFALEPLVLAPKTDRGRAERSEAAPRYELIAAANSGRAFVKRLQTEIARCSN